ncbi:MAG: putative serine/threonine-protein kinase pknH [Labilithrix sp.]|nr:putative serine/threonine-protein kinase pknH [Labilithrix sp.]
MSRPFFRPLLAFVLPIAAAVACWAPTQIVVRLETDLTCNTVSANAVAVTVAGSSDGLTTASPSAVTSDCTTKGARTDVGSLVLVPTDDRSAQIYVKVTAGVERTARECLEGDAAGCIVARRRVSFIAHRSLDLGIRLDRACLGISCGDDATCSGGICVPLDQCVEADCTPDGDGGSPDGGGRLACTPGLADCDGDSRNGCEADLGTTAHCGACGHDCGTSLCSAGTCESSVLVGGLDSPRGLAIAGGEVYVGLDLEAPSGSVVRCPLGGCAAPVTVSKGHSHPYTFAISGSTLFFGDEQKGTYRCALPGCTAPSVVCQDGPQSLIVNGEDVIFASYANAYAGRCAPGSPLPSYFALTPGEPLFVAHGGDAVFIAQSSSGKERSGGIDRCPLPAGCGTTPRPAPLALISVANGYNQPSSLAVDEAYVYWTESGTGNVMRAPKGLDQPAIAIATGARTRSLVVDDAHVYWIEQGTTDTDGTIHRANKDGSGHLVLARQQALPAQLALGPNSEPIQRIFWTTRVPKGEVRFASR